MSPRGWRRDPSATSLPKGGRASAQDDSKKRVLVFTPTYGGLLRPETVESVRQQTFGGEAVHYISYDQPHRPPDYRNCAYNYALARDIALREGCDALVTVEHDVRIPSHALDCLLAVNAPVVYGVYVFRENRKLSALEWVGPEGAGASLSDRPTRLMEAKRKEVLRVSGLGFGCTLFRRSVLEQIPFRLGEDGQPPDTPFAEDCRKANILQMAHFGVLCGHWDGRQWLWPIMAADGPRGIRVRARRNVTVKVTGDVIEMIAGREYEIPTTDIEKMLRNKWAELADGE